MISEDTPETGCWVLNEKTEKHEWRPVTIEYSDETHIAIRDWASILDITNKQKDKWWQQRNKAKKALDQLAEELTKEKEALMVKAREKVKDYSIADRQEAIKTAKQKLYNVTIPYIFHPAENPINIKLSDWTKKYYEHLGIDGPSEFPRIKCIANFES